MRSRSILRVVVQLLAFGLGVGVLVWTGWIAFKPGNREVLARLWDAPVVYPITMVLLSLLTIAVNGAIFWVQLRPVKRLGLTDVLSVNAIASLLSYLPFKLSLVFRVLIHVRHDRMNLLTIGAWMAAVAVVILTVLVPFAAMGALRQQPDMAWAIGSLLGVALLSAAMMLMCGWFASEARWRSMVRFVDRLPLPFGTAFRRILHKPEGPLDRIHEGVRMLAHPRAVIPAIGLRMMDVATHAAKFYLAAKVLGVPLSADQAAMAGSVYFLIGVVAPAGQMGAREGGTAGLVKLVIPALDFERFVIVTLLVSITELLVLMFAAGAGFAWLRPDRYQRKDLRAANRAVGATDNLI